MKKKLSVTFMAKSKNIFSVIGLMSGTSMDGVDLAYCLFRQDEKKWRFQIKNAVTLPYSAAWKKRLIGSSELSGYDLQILHKRYGNYLGGLVKNFITGSGLKVDFIASHGHTVFHRPEKHFTFQLGDGSAIAAACGHPVVCDFRSADVALGGQGAPLVPIGDELLFPEYDFCLNLGGFANISYRHRGNRTSPGIASFVPQRRIAFDICPCNVLLNRLSAEVGKEFDADGNIARCGKMDERLLNKLNDVKYYGIPPPKSLGREWAEEKIFPLFNDNANSADGKLRTAVEHIAFQISCSINKNLILAQTRKSKLEKNGVFKILPHGEDLGGANILVTGGGAHNTFLIERLKSSCGGEIKVPQKHLVDFKEALVFAFLGVLRWRGEINCLKSVTGAKSDSCCGAVFL